MLNWVVDARDIRDESAFDYGLMLKTFGIEDFLSRKRDNLFFVMATKGLGKTFVLKAKSILYTRDGIPLIHDNILVDKPGASSIIFSRDKLNSFLSLPNWVNLWTLSIGLAVIKKLKLTNSIKGYSSVLDELISCPARSITSYAKAVLSLSIPEFHTAVDDLNKYVIPAIEQVQTPIAAFIDNVDEYFDTHINLQKYKGPSTEGVISKDIWYLSQIGLVEAIYQLTGKNNHLKIFASIRKEAYLKIVDLDSKALQYKGSSVDLTYSHEELKEIFNLNIRREQQKRLCVPEALDSDPIFAFLGFRHIVHSRIGETEKIFDYITRHTLLRPRDFMLIGNYISSMRPSDRTQINLKRTINNASSEIIESYLKEVRPHIDDIDFGKLYALINTNILTGDDLKIICGNYNDANCDNTECADCHMQHVFCTLYMLGLLGYAKQDQVKDDTIQHFLMPGMKPFDVKGHLTSKSDFYLIHPCLYDVILQKNPNFKPDETNIVGYNYSLKNYLKWRDHTLQTNLTSGGRLFSLGSTTEKSCHVHFGAGRLGLGLVVPLLQESCRIVIIQRPSQHWDVVKDSDVLKLKVNNEELMTFDVIHESACSADMTYVVKRWESDNNLIVYTSNDILKKSLLEEAESISTALGSNLHEIIDILQACVFQKPINLYPFENNKKEVSLMAERLKNKNNLTIVPIIADKICANRDITENYINIDTERYYSIVLLKCNSSVHHLFGGNENIILTNSVEEQEFYYRRKYYIVNGIHMVVALYAYSYLKEKNIPLHEWAGYHLTVLWDILDRTTIDTFVKIQALRLIFETEIDTLAKVYDSKTKDEIFAEILHYGNSVLTRISETVDKLFRILNLDDPNKLEAKFNDRIEKIIDFVQHKSKEASDFGINVGLSSDELYTKTMDLQRKANGLFLGLLLAQQGAQADRQQRGGI
jgi:hypothetical protein